MRTRLGLIAALLLAGSCGPNHRQVCAASQRNRAEGKYEQQTPEAAKAAHSQYAYSCLDVCVEGFDRSGTAEQASEAPACIEAHLLAADADPPEHMDDVIEDCDRGTGPALACGWVDKHAADLERWRAEHARRQAAEAPIASEPAPFYDVAGFVAELKGYEASQGFSLVTDVTYAFDYGYIPFALPTQPGVQYHVVLVGGPNHSFSARLDGWGTEILYFKPPAVPVQGVHVRILNVQLGESDDTSPQIVIAADGGDQGDVRVLVFAR